MIKLLYTIGDSWTFGDELVFPELHSYPTLLSKELGCELENDAINGGPNDWMYRKTIEWVCSQDNLDDVAVIVGWSSVNRREENYQIYHGAYQDDEVDKFIFDRLYNEELEHYRTICNMVSLQEFLKSKNVKYLFYQPWYDVLDCEGILDNKRQQKNKFNWLMKDDSFKDYRKECYTDVLTIGKIIEQVDMSRVIGPVVNGYEKEYDVKSIMSGIFGRREDGRPKMHPNEEVHKIISKYLKEKLIQINS